MTHQEAFILISNLDLSEAERTRGPLRTLLFFDRNAEVQAHYRYKQPPRDSEIQSLQANHPGCLALVVSPHSYRTEQNMVKAIKHILRKPQPPMVTHA